MTKADKPADPEIDALVERIFALRPHTKGRVTTNAPKPALGRKRTKKIMTAPRRER